LRCELGRSFAIAVLMFKAAGGNVSSDLMRQRDLSKFEAIWALSVCVEHDLGRCCFAWCVLHVEVFTHLTFRFEAYRT
jgi:hypothetical protein